ncbi:hypothetical protein EUGRSUZ_D01067 [Eucalyptus grandis]|uniref:Uncharacterized protein n=3 Tax=Eucalyptus grandis TaxID=71139 RepID=A0ACC3L4Z6_EUCGR|nr:hypothetical protein EUGRSUZ_D01067 [Eucalyptus grandis]
MLLFILSSLLFLFFLKIFSSKNATKSSRTKHLPPGPKKLPFIGNLHHFIGSLPHLRLSDLAKTYGPIFHLQLGELSVVTTHELTFAQRPTFVFMEMAIYPNMIFSPYGEYWRQMRKICVTELLSAPRVRSFKSIREEEARGLVDNMRSLSCSPFNLSEKIFAFSNSIISKAAVGRRCKQQEAFIALLKESVALTGGFGVAEIFPSLKILTRLSRMKSKLDMLVGKMDKIFDSIIEEHKMEIDRSSRINEDDALGGGEDILDVLLRLEQSKEVGFHPTVDDIKGLILELFGAGSYSSSATVEWTMSELIRNPEVMAKAQAEVRQALKGKHHVEESDLNELKYLKSIIKETLRLHPPAPLIPREAIEEAEIDGYRVPVNSRIIVNALTLGRDPDYWTDSEKYEPERFLESLVDFKGTDFQFLPFGSGRRSCPGTAFAYANIELLLASFLYHFDWKLPNGKAPEELDMTETFGMVVKRKNDLNVIAIPYTPELAA